MVFWILNSITNYISKFGIFKVFFYICEEENWFDVTVIELLSLVVLSSEIYTLLLFEIQIFKIKIDLEASNLFQVNFELLKRK